MGNLCELSSDLRQIINEAGALALKYRKENSFEFKPDGTIVTNADKKVEDFIRSKLSQLLPQAAMWGEESELEEPGPDGLWLVDPIDGTSNYYFGLPTWGVSIGLMQQGKVVLGAVALPELNEIYHACTGEGSYLNNERLSPIQPGPIESHELIGYSLDVLKAVAPHVLPGKLRHAGAVVVDACWTISGRLRCMMEAKAKLYDMAACVCIARETNLDVRFIDGREFDENEWIINQKITTPLAFLPKDCQLFVPN